MRNGLGWAFFAGLLFGAGLIISGMTEPHRVVGFLDIGGDWMPGLALVMIGAIGVYLPVHRLVLRRSRPLVTAQFDLPRRRDVDGRLILGSVLFGIGWGIGGFCPGPAITAVGGFAGEAAIFVASMYLGFWIESRFTRRR